MSYSTIIAGLLISFLMLEISGIYPGGIIVPCYLSYYIASEPLRVLSTFVAAGLTLVCYRAVSGHLLIFGRRKYVFMLSVAAVLAMVSGMLLPRSGLESDFRIIGIIVPGLIAYNAERQGAVRTAAATIIASVIAYLGSFAVNVLLRG